MQSGIQQVWSPRNQDSMRGSSTPLAPPPATNHALASTDCSGTSGFSAPHVSHIGSKEWRMALQLVHCSIQLRAARRAGVRFFPHQLAPSAATASKLFECCAVSRTCTSVARDESDSHRSGRRTPHTHRCTVSAASPSSEMRSSASRYTRIHVTMPSDTTIRMYLKYRLGKCSCITSMTLTATAIAAA